MAATSLALPLLVRLAGTPWFLGGSLSDDLVAILAHTVWQFALLTYHTATWVREPIFWIQASWVAWWLVDHYGFPAIPIPHLPQFDFSATFYRPRLNLLGHCFQVQPSSLPPLNFQASPPLSTLVSSLGYPSTWSLSRISLLPLPPGPSLPPPFLTGGPNACQSFTFVEITVPMDFSCSLSSLRWWLLSDVDVATSRGAIRIRTDFPDYMERWEQAYEITKFFTELFTGGQLRIG